MYSFSAARYYQMTRSLGVGDHYHLRKLDADGIINFHHNKLAYDKNKK